MADSSPSFLQTTPVDVVIQGLQSQIDELKVLQQQRDAGSAQATANDANNANTRDLLDEIDRLKKLNDKAEYRIGFLLRALHEMDQKRENKE